MWCDVMCDVMWCDVMWLTLCDWLESNLSHIFSDNFVPHDELDGNSHLITVVMSIKIHNESNIVTSKV